MYWIANFFGFSAIFIIILIFIFSPHSQIPQLLAMFDKKKKGYITMDDFIVSTNTENNVQHRILEIE